jgi:hypothetical protein
MPSDIPIEQAACNALAAYLRSQLPADIVVSSEWPKGRTLPSKAITIVLGPEQDRLLYAPRVVGERIVHRAISPPVEVPEAIDVPSATALLNALRSSYELHRVSLEAHASRDDANPVLLPESADLPSALLLANGLREKLLAHARSPAHATPDDALRIRAAEASDAPSLIALANSLRTALHDHYLTRLYLWQQGDLAFHVQLDLWAAYEPVLQAMRAQVEPLLHAGDSHLPGGSDNPVHLGVSAELGDGWQGCRAWFYFSAYQSKIHEAAVSRSEYRGTYQGRLHVPFVIAAQRPRIAEVTFQSPSWRAVLRTP